MKNPNPIHSIKDAIPEEGALLRVFFTDGSCRDGFRIGPSYWSRGQNVQPERWQLLPRVGAILQDDGQGKEGPNCHRDELPK